jgi:hypothetical protein
MHETMNKHLDLGTQLTLAITLVLFGIALFEKGFTHDLLLEAGVFLVSVKLIIMSYKATVTIAASNSQLVAMRTSLERIEQSLQTNPTADANTQDEMRPSLV